MNKNKYQLDFEVTKDDIAKGERCDPDKCPLAIALRRTTNLPWKVWTLSGYLNEDVGDCYAIVKVDVPRKNKLLQRLLGSKKEKHHIRFDKRMYLRLKRFDNTGEMSPMNCREVVTKLPKDTHVIGEE